MSGIGFWELIFLFLIGLLVLGPERLPRVANQLGSWLGQARRMTRVLKRQLEDELNLENATDFRPRPALKPLPAKPSEPPEPPEERPDTWSPAHDDKSPGTGVEAAGDAKPPQDTDFVDTDVLDSSNAPAAGSAAQERNTDPKT